MGGAASVAQVLLPILLNARGAQTSQPMLVDRHLPAEEFINRQRIAAAGLFQGQEPTAHRCDHFRLAANDPALGRRWRKIRYRQRTPIWSDDIFYPWSDRLGHLLLTNSTDPTLPRHYSWQFNICLSGAPIREKKNLLKIISFFPNAFTYRVFRFQSAQCGPLH